MSKPDKIVEGMKRLEARRIGLPLYLCSKEAEKRWNNTAFQFIPYALKLLQEKDKEVERLIGELESIKYGRGNHLHTDNAEAKSCHLCQLQKDAADA